jgi:hypothetical protein
MKNNESSAEVVEKAAGAIWSLAPNNDNQIKLSELGACELLLLVMKKYENSAVVVQQAAGALGNLAVNNNDNKIKLSNLGACESCVSMLKIHSKVLATGLQLLRCSESLLSVEANRKRYSSSGFLVIANQILKDASMISLHDRFKKLIELCS